MGTTLKSKKTIQKEQSLIKKICCENYNPQQNYCNIYELDHQNYIVKPIMKKVKKLQFDFLKFYFCFLKKNFFS